MVIKASASAEIRQLIAALGSDDEVRREAAIARLSIIGERAVDRLVAAYGAGTREVKIAALRALEGSGDTRALTVARRGIGEGGDVALAAAATLKSLLSADHEAAAAGALDTLVTTALDAGLERRLRVTAVEALADVPGDAHARVADALASDPDAGLQARALDSPREAAAADAIWQDALDGRLPDAPADFRAVLRPRGAAAPLGVLQTLIDAVRQKEGSVAGGRRAEWMAVRGSLHQALALRGSRLAVYDLRETVADAREALPASFLAALHVVGDESCLEEIAGAYARARPDDAPWRHQLAAAFRAVSKRERITRRHAAMRRIAARWPDAAAGLLGS